jgi:hypothetical protein
MPTTYIEKYTGKITTTPSSTTCNVGDKYFVNFNELTRPRKDNPTDNGYKLTLIATDLGDNLKGSTSSWNLTTNCWYKVKNMSFPQGGTAGNTDENYSSYGNNAFVFRQIEVDNPFPDREPGANWYGKEDLILTTKDMIDRMVKFKLTLNSSLIKKTREYNDIYPYDTFNLNGMEKSLFLENNIDNLIRK